MDFNSPLNNCCTQQFEGLCEVVQSRDKNFTEKAISEDEEKIKKVITAINENSNKSFY